MGTTQKNVLIVGAGNIGLLAACLLADAQDFQVFLADIKKLDTIPEIKHNPIHFLSCDVLDQENIIKQIKQHTIEGIISCLPYHLTIKVAEIAAATGLYYFDLTEDIKATELISQLAQTNGQAAFAQQCGLAPGLISIIANNLMQDFTDLKQVKVRVGALPTNVSNSLHYAFNWSTQGVINEYVNSCQAIMNYQQVMLPALDGLEEIKIDGVSYEAFNTSGGLGSLADTYAGKVCNMNYKTIRYHGHCDKMKFLLQELKFSDNQDVLIEALEKVIPKAEDDKVLIYISVEGVKHSNLVEKNYTKKFYSKFLYGHQWTAIQMTTACSLCVSVDLVMNEKRFDGPLVKQEQIHFTKDFLPNRFAEYFQ